MPYNIFQVPATGHTSGSLSRPKAADLLQLNPRSIDLLLESGYLPDLDIARILRLADRPTLESDNDQPVLRQALSAPAPAGESREFIGESASLTDPQVVESDRQWWRSDPEMICPAGLLPVTLAGFPVTVLKIAGTDGSPIRATRAAKTGRAYTEVRHAYKATLAGRVRELGTPERDYICPSLTVDEQKTVELILGGRSTARSGGPIAYLPKRTLQS